MAHGSYRGEPQALEKRAVDTQQEKRDCLFAGRDEGFMEEEASASLILKNGYDLDILKHREGLSN